MKQFLQLYQGYGKDSWVDAFNEFQAEAVGIEKDGWFVHAVSQISVVADSSCSIIVVYRQGGK